MKQKERLQGELAATRSWARDLEPSFLEPPEGRNPADTTLIPSLRFKPSSLCRASLLLPGLSDSPCRLTCGCCPGWRPHCSTPQVAESVSGCPHPPGWLCSQSYTHRTHLYKHAPPFLCCPCPFSLFTAQPKPCLLEDVCQDPAVLGAGPSDAPAPLGGGGGGR